MKEIKPRSHIDATVTMPGSKSISHRALIAASLARGSSQIKNFLVCEDTLYTINALRELGIQMSTKGEKVIVSGTGGELPPSPGRKEIFLGNSGTSYRLLLSIVALAQGEFVLTGSQRMCQRPIRDLVRALEKLGAEASYVEKNDFPPVLIKAKGIHGGKVQILGHYSSQYVSSLLLASPCAERDVEIEVKGELVSGPYVDLTLDVMEWFGVCAFREGYSYFKIPSQQGYISCQFTVEGDVSSASYFWAAAAVTGGSATTANIHPHTHQGDIRFLHILEQMGCRVEKATNQVVVHGGTLSGIDADMSLMPDLVPTLAAVALFADGRTSIRNVPHLRHKESDRLRSVSLELGKLGGRVKEISDGLIIHGGYPLSGTAVSPHDDHRIAMSLAIVGLKVPGIKIKNQNCVKKSFPQFWELWDKM